MIRRSVSEEKGVVSNMWSTWYDLRAAMYSSIVDAATLRSPGMPHSLWAVHWQIISSWAGHGALPGKVVATKAT